jgi:osmotically-inducible protein OsmY
LTLTGHVRSFAQKVAAERAAARVKGVRAVAEEIEVKLPYDIKRGDESIAEAAIEQDSSVPPDAIEIQVEKGWITLNGGVDWHRSWIHDPKTIEVRAQGGKIRLTRHVTTRNARDLAGNTAWSAPGATFVENEIAMD